MFILRVYDAVATSETFYYSEKISVVMEQIAFLLGEQDLPGGIFSSIAEAKEDAGMSGFEKGEAFPRFAVWQFHDPTTESATDAADNQIRDRVSVIMHNDDPEATLEDKYAVVLLMDIFRAEPI
jgi:hypothetical protein